MGNRSSTNDQRGSNASFSLQRENGETEAEKILEADNETSPEIWHCRRCEAENDGSTEVCELCETLRNPNLWRCRRCTLHNDIAALRCEACGSQDTFRWEGTQIDAADAKASDKRRSEGDKDQGGSRMRLVPESTKLSTKRAKSDVPAVGLVADDEDTPNTSEESTKVPEIIEVHSKELPIKRSEPACDPIQYSSDLDSHGSPVKRAKLKLTSQTSGLPSIPKGSRKERLPRDEGSQREVTEREWIGVLAEAWQGRTDDILNSCRELDTSGEFEHVVWLRSKEKSGMDVTELVRLILLCNPTGHDGGPAETLRWMMRMVRLTL